MFKTVVLMVTVLGLAIASPSYAMSHYKVLHNHSYGKRIPYPSEKKRKEAVQHTSFPKDDKSCLREAVIYESRGVQSTDTRVFLARSILSRVGKPGFPNSVCGVTYQKRVNKKKHTVTPQFSWTIHRPSIYVSGKELVQSTKIADKAVEEYRRRGPVDAVFFSSNGICPVPTKHRFRKGPFTFCEPLRLG